MNLCCIAKIELFTKSHVEVLILFCFPMYWAIGMVQFNAKHCFMCERWRFNAIFLLILVLVYISPQNPSASQTQNLDLEFGFSQMKS